VSTIHRYLREQDILSALALEGYAFYASDADQNDMVTGQTSFAATTPTFLLDVPLGTTAIPLLVALSQAGTVAGGDITILMEIDNADRYDSGGTEETVLCARTTGGKTNSCKLYSGATAAAGYGVRIWGVQVAADVSPAEGVVNEPVWTPAGTLDYIVGPGALAIYTYAAATGPTWLWTIKWLEIATADLFPQ
jgi:hypothetical protein